MSNAGVVLLYLDVALMAIAIAGLVVRDRVRASPVLVVYLATSIVICLGLERFYSWGYWLVAGLVQAALRLALCVDLSARIFARLPGARRRSVLILAAGTTALLIVVLRLEAASVPATNPYLEGSIIGNHVTHAGAWLMASVLAVAYYYAIPVDRFHRELGAGLVVWSAVQALSGQLVVLDDWIGIGRAGLPRLVYAGVLLVVTIEAWRRDEHCPPELVWLLRPWRRRPA